MTEKPILRGEVIAFKQAKDEGAIITVHIDPAYFETAPRIGKQIKIQEEDDASV